MQENPHTKLTVAGGTLRMLTQSGAGDADERVAIAHADVSLGVDPNLILQALPHAAGISFFPDCVRLNGNGYTCLISTIALRGAAAEAAETGDKDE